MTDKHITLITKVYFTTLILISLIGVVYTTYLLYSYDKYEGHGQLVFAYPISKTNIVYILLVSVLALISLSGLMRGNKIGFITSLGILLFTTLVSSLLLYAKLSQGKNIDFVIPISLIISFYGVYSLIDIRTFFFQKNNFIPEILSIVVLVMIFMFSLFILGFV